MSWFAVVSSEQAGAMPHPGDNGLTQAALYGVIQSGSGRSHSFSLVFIRRRNGGHVTIYHAERTREPRRCHETI